MKGWGSQSFAPLAIALWASALVVVVDAREDGFHRVQKRAQITAAPILGLREEKEEGKCGTSMKLCPMSQDGGCCPEDYDCGVHSCYATSKGPSTCGTKVGWHGCAASVGGGCCPDGYDCERGGACVPPSGSPYTLGCPKSQYLCPASASYGCCPEGMGCGVNQCFSTKPETITTTMTITTTEDGDETTYRTTGTTVTTPEVPSGLTNINADDDDDDQAVLKYFPEAVAKVSATGEAENDDDEDDSGGSGSGGLSSAALGGIVAGSIIFLIIILIAAYIIIRHLNKVVAAVSQSGVSKSSAQSGGARQPPMREFRPTDSEVDAMSVDPLMMSPNREHAAGGHLGGAANVPRGDNNGTPSDGGGLWAQPTPDLSSNPTPNSFVGGYQAVSSDGNTSRHTSFDAMGNQYSYFDNQAHSGRRDMRISQSSVTPPNPSHRVSADSHARSRHYSNASELSADDMTIYSNPPNSNVTELDVNTFVPELLGSPTNIAFPAAAAAAAAAGDDSSIPRRRSNGNSGRPPLQPHRRSIGASKGEGSASGKQDMLGVVSEEIHGFHGPTDRTAGVADPGTGTWTSEEGEEKEKSGK